MKISQVLSVFLILAFVSAQSSIKQIIQSSEALVGALDSTFDFAIAQYIPGYGLQVNARWSGASDAQEFLTTTAGVITGLSKLVQGLKADDFISVSYTLDSYPELDYYTVRLVPSQPNSLEVFINGDLQ